jgi:hypothetical protein
MPIARVWFVAGLLSLAAAPACPGQAARTAEKKVALVELFTSQGCDMGPGAEKLLGSLPTRGYGKSRVLVLAYHVDYFNKPWQDPFSSPEYSSRNMAYHTIFRKRDKGSPELYFTPMIMVAGKYPTSGFYHEGEDAAWAALRQRLDKALAEAPAAAIELPPAGTAGPKRTIRARPLGTKVLGRPVLACAAVTEDGLATAVGSGENAGKTLPENHIVRSFIHQEITLRRSEPTAATFDLELPAGADPARTTIVYFLQDPATGSVFQAASEPWPATTGAADDPRK